MQQKFNADDPEARFEFREEYWVQAQALIAHHEREKRRRRFLFFWWVLAGAALLTTLGWWWLSRPNAIFTAERQVDQATIAAGADQADAAADTRHNITAKSGSNGKAIDQMSGHTTPQPTDPVHAKAAAKSTSGAPRQPDDKPKTIKSGAASEPAVGDLPTNPLEPGGAATAALEALRGASNNPMPEKTTGFSPTQAVETVLPIALASHKVSLERLPTLMRPKPEAIIFTKIIKPHRDHAKNREYGLQMALSYAPEAKRAGFSLGVFAQYRLKNQWFVFTGLGARVLPIAPSDANNVGTEQTFYSFGFTRQRYQEESRNFLLLEAPVALQYRRRRSWLEGGLLVNYMVGAQGRVVKTLESSLAKTESNIDQAIVAQDLRGYRRLTLNYFVGGGVRLGNGPDVFMRGAIRPGGFKKALADAATTGSVFWIDAGVRFRF